MEHEMRHKFYVPNSTLDIFIRKDVYYFYILECNNGSRYYGHTNNLPKRLKAHRKGRVISTKLKRPITLVYYKEFSSRSEAYRREMQFKNGRTRKNVIERLIKSFDKEKCQGFNSCK